MKTILATILCLAAAATAAPQQSYRISPFGIVENVEDCGSKGTLQTVAVADCTRAPCHFVPGRTYDIDIVFVASRSSSRLTLNIRVLLDTGSEHLVAQVPVEGEISAGQQFTISFGLPITTQYSGRSMVVWFELMDAIDDHMEICATASAHIA